MPNDQMAHPEIARSQDTLVGEILAMAQPIYQYMMASHLETWTRLDITMPQFKVLTTVAAHRRLDSPYVGRHLGMLPSTLTRIVDKLVARDLVRRGEDPRDRRVVHLEVTDKAMGLLCGLAEDAVPGPMGAVLQQLSEDELRQIRAGFALFAEGITRLHQSNVSEPE